MVVGLLLHAWACPCLLLLALCSPSNALLTETNKRLLTAFSDPDSLPNAQVLNPSEREYVHGHVCPSCRSLIQIAEDGKDGDKVVSPGVCSEADKDLGTALGEKGNIVFRSLSGEIPVTSQALCVG